jgi:hypothetical protein
MHSDAQIARRRTVTEAMKVEFETTRLQKGLGGLADL